MTNRYFENPFPDYNCSQEIINIGGTKVLNLIRQYVNTILTNTHPNQHKKGSGTSRRGDLYVGDAGIAFMFLKLHLSSVTKDILGTSALEHAQAYIETAKRNVSGRKEKSCAFLSGDAGIYAVSTVINHICGEENEKEKDLNNFLRGFKVCKKLDYAGEDSSDEFLIGRAGYIAGMYWLNQLISPKCVNSDEIVELCSVMLTSGRRYSHSQKLDIPLMYQYHGSEYLGAAHGLSAILWCFLESPWFAKSENTDQLSHISSTKLKDIKDTIDKFLSLQDTEGNFPTKWNNRDKRLVHWCHGSPGNILVFAKAYLIFKEEKYLTACENCAENIWNEGILRKGPSICHGIAGNGYTFLLMYRLTLNTKYLYRAYKFMEFLTNDDFIKHARTPDRPFSLYEGLSGTVCFLVDLLAPDQAHFPFMDVFTNKFEL